VTAPGSGGSRLLAPILAVVLGALVLCGSAGTAFWRGVSNSVGGGDVDVDPNSVPAVCGLVPADLMSRVAPGATPDDNDDRYPTGLQVTRDCQASTGRSGDTSAELRIQVTRYGTFLDYPPREHAKKDFIDDKEIAPKLSMGPPKDVAGLGDSAFITVDPEPVGDFQRAQVHVLRADVIVTVTYTANPSTADLVASATVTVARSVLENLS
jgi:hypothetical protein